MIHDNLKALRKSKGYTQEELASRLNVVRQTVSKWEKGLSVPDAEMLMKLAEIFEVPVSRLLGTAIEQEQEPDQIAQQLARINAQLVIRNRRSRRIWKAVAVVIGVIAAVQLIIIGLGMALSATSNTSGHSSVVETQAFEMD